MNIFMYCLIICIVVCIILIWCMNTFNRFQGYIIRMNEAEANIDSTLRKRFDLLNKSIGVIKANTDIEEEIMENVIKLRSRKLTNFELDRQLYEAINEFNTYRENYPELKNSEAFMKIEIGLNESEAEIVASRKYYNDIITDYNKIVKVFPSNLVARACSYKQKTYFDGKVMDGKDNFKL